MTASTATFPRCFCGGKLRTNIPDTLGSGLFVRAVTSLLVGVNGRGGSDRLVLGSVGPRHTVLVDQAEAHVVEVQKTKMDEIQHRANGWHATRFEHVHGDVRLLVDRVERLDPQHQPQQWCWRVIFEDPDTRGAVLGYADTPAEAMKAAAGAAEKAARRALAPRLSGHHADVAPLGRVVSVEGSTVTVELEPGQDRAVREMLGRE